MSKGVFIEGITVDMLRNACLEAVEELLNEGDMVDMEVKPTEWIPCSERLPEEDTDVPKTGRWTKVIDQETPNVVKWHYECDQCGAGRFENGQRYCSQCGARMLGENGEEE